MPLGRDQQSVERETKTERQREKEVGGGPPGITNKTTLGTEK